MTCVRWRGVVASEPVRIPERIRFGEDFELDIATCTLRRAGRVLKLERIPMEVLLFLLEQRGQLVTRDQIVERIWGKDVFLDTDNSINGAIRKVRQVLKDDAERPRFIQTITGKGYRFIAPVVDPAALTSSVVPPTGIGDGRANQSTRSTWPETATSEPSDREPIQSEAPPRLRSIRIALALVVLIAGLAGWLVWSRFFSPQPHASRVMLAVLPFQNLTGDPSQDYFSDGLTEEMLTQLGSLDQQHLGVIARTSVMHYKGSVAALDQIGRELGVQYVIEGSVRRDEGRVRISAQLIHVKDQSHVWAREYDRELKSLLTLQGEIAQEIADEIQLTLGDRHKTGAGHATISAPSSYEAYDLYLKGLYFWNKRTEADFQRAAEYFQKAMATDQNFARAYVGLADTYGLMSTWSMGPQNELMPKARAAALKALELDETLAEAHTSLGLVAEAYDYDWQTAEKEFRRAIQLNPDYATAHQWYAEYLSWQGRFDEAFAESERARQLDPLSLIIATDRGAIYYCARQYDRAIAQSRAVLDMDPNFAEAQTNLFGAYVQAGRFAEALEIWKREPADSPWTWADKAYLYGRWGQTREAQHALEKFERLAAKLGSNSTWAHVVAYIGAEQKDKVIALLQKACAEHSYNLAGIKVDPVYDPLRSDPRFQDLLRRVGLAQ